MLDRWAKVATIAAPVVFVVAAIIAPGIGGIFWLARLDSDVSHLQADVTEVQADVTQLQLDVGQLQLDVGQLQLDVAQIRHGVRQIQEAQQVMLGILQSLVDDRVTIREDLTGHTHDSDGRAQFFAAGTDRN